MERSISVRLSAKVRLVLVLFLLFMFIFALLSCDSGSRPASQPLRASLSAANESERSLLVEDVSRLRKNIDREIEKLRQQYETIDSRSRDRWNFADRKLKSNRAKADKIIHDLQNCTDETWESVKTSTLKIAGEIKSSNQTLAYDFQEWFAGE